MKKKLLFLSLPLVFTMLASCSGEGTSESTSVEPPSSSSETSSSSELTPEEIVDKIVNPENATLVSKVKTTYEATEDEYVYTRSTNAITETKITKSAIEGSMQMGEQKMTYPIPLIGEQMRIENPTDEQLQAYYEMVKPHLVGDNEATFTIDRTNDVVIIDIADSDEQMKAYVAYDSTIKQWIDISYEDEKQEVTLFLDSEYQRYVVNSTFKPYEVFYSDLLTKGTYNESTKTYTYEPNKNYKYASELLKVTKMYMTMANGLPSKFGFEGSVSDFGSSTTEYVVIDQEIKNYNTTTITVPQYEIPAHDHTYCRIEYDYVDKDYCRPYCSRCNRYLGEKEAHHVTGTEDVCAHCLNVVNGTETHWEDLEKVFDNEYTGLVKATSNKIYDKGSTQSFESPSAPGRVGATDIVDKDTYDYTNVYYYPTQKALIINTYHSETPAEHSCMLYINVTSKLITNIEIELPSTTSEAQEFLSGFASQTVEAIVEAYPGSVSKGSYEFYRAEARHNATGTNIKETIIDACHDGKQRICDECGLRYSASISEHHEKEYQKTTKPENFHNPTSIPDENLLYVKPTCKNCDEEFDYIYLIQPNHQDNKDVRHDYEGHAHVIIYFLDGTHYGDDIITLPHFYNDDGVCTICGGKLLTDNAHEGYQLVFSPGGFAQHYRQGLELITSDRVYSPYGQGPQGYLFENAYIVSMEQDGSNINFVLSRESTVLANFTYVISE